MTTDIVTTNNEMVEFSDEMITRAGEILGCKLDRSSIYKALCIQRDTGLSIVRGEISIVQYNGKPVVQINKQGYITFANTQKDYDNYEWGWVDEDGPFDKIKCWVKVYRKDRTRPIYECIKMSEFNKGTANWKIMPLHMLKVRCLSLALREAFPLLNGTYTDDEVADMRAANKIEPMDTDITITPEEIQTEQPAAAEVEKPKPANDEPLLTEAQAKNYFDTFKAVGMSTDIFTDAAVPMKGGMFYKKNLLDAYWEHHKNDTKQT